jgi:protein-serine/threonine kinase
VELDKIMKDPIIPETQKRRKEQEIRRAEVAYLRFLRTKERAENFQTIKIIGKGAFGEVRLVQRKNDGKIYALKSLIKSEMVSLQAQWYCTLIWIVQKRSACSRPL